jgi:multisubunit Na+/H+ antiporter MnhG subunit
VHEQLTAIAMQKNGARIVFLVAFISARERIRRVNSNFAFETGKIRLNFIFIYIHVYFSLFGPLKLARNFRPQGHNKPNIAFEVLLLGSAPLVAFFFLPVAKMKLRTLMIALGAVVLASVPSVVVAEAANDVELELVENNDVSDTQGRRELFSFWGFLFMSKWVVGNRLFAET